MWSLCMLYKKAKSQQTIYDGKGLLWLSPNKPKKVSGSDVTLMKGMEADHIKCEQFYSWTNSLR